MYLTIGDDPRLAGADQGLCFLDTARRRGVLFGECLGYVGPDRTLEREECVPELAGILSRGEDPTPFLRWSVGRFVLAVESDDSVKLYGSPRYRGYFYYPTADGLCINGDELSSARECLDGGLDDMELLYYLFQAPTPSAAPFRTIFKQMRRAIGGTVLTATGSSEPTIELYVGSVGKSRHGMTDEDYYLFFKRLFDDTCRLLGRSIDSPSTYLQISGGIDSAICLISLLKQGFQVIPLHWRKDRLLSEAVALFCERLNVSPVFFGLEYGQFDPIKLDWDVTLRHYSRALGMTGPNNMNYALPDPTATYVSGFGGGALVQIDDQHRVSFGELPLTYHVEDTKTRKVYRFLFTRWFWRFVRWKLAGPYVWLAERIAGQRHLRAPANNRDYLMGLCLSGKVPSWPLEGLPHSLEWAWEEYVDHVDHSVLEPVAGAQRYARVNADGGSGLSYEECVELMRQIRFATETQRGNKHAVGYEDGTGARRESPITEGPMVSFFMDFPIGMRDVFSVKRYFYRYFREEVGFSYPEYLAMLRRRVGITFRSKVIGKMSQLLRKMRGGRAPRTAAIHNSLMDSSYYRDHYLPAFEPDESRLLPMIEDVRLRESLHAQYQRYQDSDLGRVSPDDARVMNQLLNLELFLRSASEAPSQSGNRA